MPQIRSYVLHIVNDKMDTYPSPKNLDSNFVSFWRSDFNVLNGQFSSSFPCNCRLPRNESKRRVRKEYTLQAIVFPVVSDIFEANVFK